MPGPYFFAWVDASETTFGPQHQVYDEEITAFTITHAEGEAAALSISIRNPHIGLLAPGRKTWAWLSWDNGADVVPLFFGELIAVPSNFILDTVELTLRAAPADLDQRKAVLAESMKVAPWYDPIWLDPAQRDEPDTVLEAYAKLWHVDRVTHALTASAITAGEDGTEVFAPSDVPYDSVALELDQAPLAFVRVDATVTWRQTQSGTLALGGRNFTSYSGDGIIADWPKPGATLAGGWSVIAAAASDLHGIGSTSNFSFSWSWQNKAKKHNNGDTLSTSVNVSGPNLRGPALSMITSATSQTGVLDPFAVDENGDPAPLNIPASSSTTTSYCPLWQVTGSMVLRYDADRERSERATFVLAADLQSIVTGEDEGELISMSGADVGTPIMSLRAWTPAAAVALGDLIFPPYPTFPGLTAAQICVAAGTTGSDPPEFSVVAGDVTIDGSVAWSSLGSVAPDASAPNWAANDEVVAGMVILPGVGLIISYAALVQAGLAQVPQQGVAVSQGQVVRAGNGSYQVCTLPGTTATPSPPRRPSPGAGDLYVTPQEPPFATAWGATTADGTAVWTSLGPTIPDGAHYHICTQPGVTGAVMPPFANALGGVTADGNAVWTNMGAGEIPAGGVPGNVPAASYFPSDRGAVSLQHLLLLARARLLYRARAVRIAWHCRFERAINLTCRKNAMLQDSRLPGGNATGKIVEYRIIGGGDGVMRGEIVAAATIGKGNAVTLSDGEPTYVELGYVEPGYQVMTGQVATIPAVGDLGYAPPAAAPVDDGLVFPLDTAQAVKRDQVLGATIAQQEDVILAAMRAAAASAQISGTPSDPNAAYDSAAGAAAGNARSVEEALAATPIWYEIELAPVTNGPFSALYAIETSALVAPKMIDLAAA